VADTAVFALAGVALGGLLSGAVDWFNDWRRARGEARFAARAVYDEFAWVAGCIELSIAEGTPESMRLGYVDLVDVKADTTMLRRLLAFPEWKAVRAAERRIEVMQREHPTEDESHLRLTSDDVKFAEGALAAISRALDVLRPYLGRTNE
jgi:hypothetical protein